MSREFLGFKSKHELQSFLDNGSEKSRELYTQINGLLRESAKKAIDDLTEDQDSVVGDALEKYFTEEADHLASKIKKMLFYNFVNSDKGPANEYRTDQDILNVIHEYALNSRSKSSIIFKIREKGNPGPNFSEIDSIFIDYTKNLDPSEYIDFIDFIPDSYVEDFADTFWNEIRHFASIPNMPTDFDSYPVDLNYGEVDLLVNEEELREAITDEIISTLDELSSNDPDSFIKKYMDYLIDRGTEEDRSIHSLLSQVSSEEEKIELISVFIRTPNLSKKEIIKMISEASGEDTENLIPMITVPLEVIKSWGITSGTIYENHPINVYSIPIQGLMKEGIDMKLCLSDPSMGYYSAIVDKTIEIWSVKTNNGKRLFTIEVETDFRSKSSPENKGKSVIQVKGKANRLPGNISKKDTTLKLKDEVIFIFSLFRDMGIDVTNSDDMKVNVKKLSLTY